MLKIYYPICCGIDVHKKLLVATIASTNEQKVTTYQTKQFSTFTKDIKKLKQWLIDNKCKDVCMESTGKYWIPIFNILEDSCNVTITVSNIMISNILTDTFGKTSKSILELILSKEDNVTMEEIQPLLRKNLKSTPQEILDSVEGNLTHEQNSKMKVCLNHYDNILDCINQIEQAILPLIQPFQNEINLKSAIF